MYKISEITSDAEWVEVAGTATSYPQSNLFKNLQERLDRRVVRFVVTNEKETVGYFQAVIYPLHKDMTSIYIPYGPVLKHGSQELIQTVQTRLQELGKQNNAVYVRTDFEVMGQLTLLPAFKKLSQNGYKTVYHQPRGEWILDITPAEEVLLGDMHKKTRYNTRKSIKNNLGTSFVYGDEIKEWTDTFVALNEQNTASHNTTTHTKTYFKHLFELLAQDGEHFLAITKKDNHVLAVNIFIRNGPEVFCPFGASNDLGKELGAYYHIKWHSILEMKKAGVATFNWGGISVGIQDEYLAGVSQFKKGFGGEEEKHGELYDVVIKPFWYFLYMLRKKFT